MKQPQGEKSVQCDRTICCSENTSQTIR